VGNQVNICGVNGIKSRRQKYDVPRYEAHLLVIDTLPFVSASYVNDLNGSDGSHGYKHKMAICHALPQQSCDSENLPGRPIG